MKRIGAIAIKEIDKSEHLDWSYYILPISVRLQVDLSFVALRSGSRELLSDRID